MKEFNSVLEVLHECRTQLIEAKARIKEREAEIDKYLSDYDKAINAITPKFEVTAEQPQEPTERLPKVGDKLVAICETSEFLTKGKTYSVIERCSFLNVQKFDIIDDQGSAHSFTDEKWREYFRFADEKLTPEDLENLHSYLHVNGEAKKPYRIKTCQEMINAGGVKKVHGGLFPSGSIDLPFIKGMEHLHGKELDTNTRQEIDNFTIEPWMITENK